MTPSRLAILSDIHGNLTALQAVLSHLTNNHPDVQAIVLLGDAVNYGMRSKEVLSELKNLTIPVIANIYGNHEKAICDGNTSQFSTERGRQALLETAKSLDDTALEYIHTEMLPSGFTTFNIGNTKCLAVHGSLTDPFWGKMTFQEIEKDIYARYDIVFCGHSHIPMHWEQMYPDPTQTLTRGKKRTIFLNPGSVGQPRNQNPRAQYLYANIDSENFCFNTVEYDIVAEQALFTNKNTDNFYSKRLLYGI